MTTGARILARVVVTDDADGQVVMAEDIAATISNVVGHSGKRETVSLTASFNALSPPSGSAALFLHRVSGNVTLTLKGVTGDTGIVLQSGTLGTIPMLIPLGTSPSIGILSDGSATVECIWL